VAKSATTDSTRMQRSTAACSRSSRAIENASTRSRTSANPVPLPAGTRLADHAVLHGVCLRARHEQRHELLAGSGDRPRQDRTSGPGWTRNRLAAHHDRSRADPRPVGSIASIALRCSSRTSSERAPAGGVVLVEVVRAGGRFHPGASSDQRPGRHRIVPPATKNDVVRARSRAKHHSDHRPMRWPRRSSGLAKPKSFSIAACVEPMRTPSTRP